MRVVIRWRREFARLTEVSSAVVGAAVYGFSQWAILIVLARYDSATSVGAYAYALAVTSPIALFFGMALRQSYVTDRAKVGTFALYLRVRLATVVVLQCVIVWLALFVRSTDVIFLAVGTAKGVDLAADLFFGPVQKSGRLVPIGVAQSLNGTVTVGIVSLLLWLGVPADRAMLGSVAGSIIGLGYAVLTARRVRRNAKERVNRQVVESGIVDRERRNGWTLFVQVLPLGLAAAVGAFRVGTPRYVLELEWGLEEVGHFAAVAYFVVAGNMLVSAVAQFSLPRFARKVSVNGLPSVLMLLSGLSLLWVTFGVIATVVGFFFGENVMALLYGDGYGGRDLIVIMAIAWSVSSVAVMCDMALVAVREFRQQLYGNIIAAVTTLAVCAVLVPMSGVVGAAWATLASSSVVLLSRIVSLRISWRNVSDEAA